MSGTESPPDEETSGTAESDHERRNIYTLVSHQVLFRTAWIFKTESVIMPAFLDSISGSGWVRGMLPPLNRFGQSLAPLILSERLANAPVKTRWLARCTTLMSLPFLCLGGLLFVDSVPSTPLVIFFLASYLLFFCVNGVAQASFNTIQGKLIAPEKRGSLMALAGYVGSPVAVLMALLLLRPWTESDPPLFAAIFLFTGSMFFLAGFVVRRLHEDPDPAGPKSALRLKKRLREAGRFLRQDRHLRRLCGLAALFVCAQLLFPHYQRLGRHQAGFHNHMLLYWVIAQNLSAALFSWLSGRLADARGTRSALRWLILCAAFAPGGALVLAEYTDANWFWLAYFLLGAVPVSFRMFLNYALELTERQNHPIYVSTVVLCMAPPILLSPFVGMLVAEIGYLEPFLIISVVVVLAWVMTLMIIEPRHDLESHQND